MQVVKGDWKFTMTSGQWEGTRAFVVYEEIMTEVSERCINRLVTYAQDIIKMDDLDWIELVITFNGRKMMSSVGIDDTWFVNRIWIDCILTAYDSQKIDIAENERENLRILYGGRV